MYENFVNQNDFFQILMLDYIVKEANRYRGCDAVELTSVLKAIGAATVFGVICGIIFLICAMIYRSFKSRSAADLS